MMFQVTATRITPDLEDLAASITLSRHRCTFAGCIRIGGLLTFLRLDSTPQPGAANITMMVMWQEIVCYYNLGVEVIGQQAKVFGVLGYSLSKVIERSFGDCVIPHFPTHAPYKQQNADTPIPLKPWPANQLPDYFLLKCNKKGMLNMVMYDL